MSHEDIAALLASSRITQVHGLKADGDGSIYAVATVDETGADGLVNNAFLALLLLAAAHTLYGQSTPLGGFTVTPMKGKRAKVGDRLVATARVVREKERTPHGRRHTEIYIRAEVRVDGVLYAIGKFRRRLTE